MTVLALLAGSLAPARGDDSAPPTPRADIDARYRAELARLDRERIEALTRLAGSQKGAEAEQTYLEVFRLAIAGDNYRDAESAATRVLDAAGKKPPGGEVEVLARLVRIIAAADRGDFEASMRDLRTALAAVPGQPSARLQSRTTLALSEAYFRRLLRARQFAKAREVCDLVIAATSADPALRDHFTDYRRRLDLIGKPAPEIAGTDADGAAVKLADLKGKVVLIVFWATWCPPSAESVPLLRHALQLHEKDGFAILGVNLDTGPEQTKAVRRFLVDFAVPWPNVLSGGPDVASAYAVTEIPASVLLDRDGRVTTMDLSRDDLLEVLATALGKKSAAR